jgi:hypothetical protein
MSPSRESAAEPRPRIGISFGDKMCLFPNVAKAEGAPQRLGRVVAAVRVISTN